MTTGEALRVAYEAIMYTVNLDWEFGATFGQFFTEAKFVDGGRTEDGISFHRVIDRALKHLKAEGTIRYDRKAGGWKRVQI